MRKAPRSEVDASLRDLHSGSKRLPWTRVIFIATSLGGQGEVGLGRVVVCSRAVSGFSGRGTRVRVFAVKRAGVRLGVGVLGKRASGIGRPRRARSGDGSKGNAGGGGGASSSVCLSNKVINKESHKESDKESDKESHKESDKASDKASDKESHPRRQLTSRRRARASAMSQAAKIFRCGRAFGLAVTSFFRLRMSIRTSVFAVWRADWLCVACWIGRRVIERVVGGGVVRA